MNNINAVSCALDLATRTNFGRNYLSASLGLMFTLIPTAASANSGHPAGSYANIATAFAPHSGVMGAEQHPWTYFAVHGASLPSGTHASASHSTFASAHSTPGFLPHVSHTTLATKRAAISLPLSANLLDLGSQQNNFSLSDLSGLKTLTITVGGKSEVVNINTKLTGAELLAADQVLGGGHQTLTINAAGAATGGTFTLSSQSLALIDSSLGALNALTVPRNVRILDTLSTLQLSGDLVNHGHILTQPTTGNSSTIQALDIINTSGASITTSSQTGAGGSLNLIAQHQLNNSGLISAGNNVNVSAPSVVNSGTIKTTSGNVNFNSNTNAAINNSAGTISAINGNINFSTAAANANVNINGGDFLSQELNIDAGTGKVNVDVGNVTGLVNIDACSAHVTAAAPNLQLGNLNVTGDPTYFNQGNITISGAIAPTDGKDLAIVASGNILSNGGSLSTIPTTAGGNGGALTLIAGANFTTSTNASSGNNDTTTTLTLTKGPGTGGGSLTGGLVDLNGTNGGKAPVTLISTAGIGAAADAGDVLIAAYGGKGANSGSVTLPKTIPLDAGTNGTGNSGSIIIIAGAAKGIAISAGTIDTSRGPAGQGQVVLSASKPTLAGNFQITDGTITSGSLSPAATFSSGAISVGNLNTGGGNVNIDTNSTVTFATINTSGAGGTSVFNFAGLPGSNAGLVNIQSGGAVTGNNIFAYGGGGGGGSIDATINGTNGGKGGNGGDITVIALNGAITLSGTVNASGGGGGGGGGASYVASGGLVGSGGAGGKGGDIDLNTSKQVAVKINIISMDGGDGGFGGLTTIANQAGGGGGGGGSYGGGGGGGAAGNAAAGGGQGAGGGGGAFGGGGGSGNSGADTAITGGAGGGYQAPGLGGTGTSKNAGGDTGSVLAGGNGNGYLSGPNIDRGGSLASGGQGGSLFGPGTDGSNVVVGGAFGGGALTVQPNANIGTKQIPQNTLVRTLFNGSLGVLTTSNVYINNGAGINIDGLEISGTLSVSASGDIKAINFSTFAQNLALTTNPGSNGSITLNVSVEGNKTAVLHADGSGAIITKAAKMLFTPSATLTSSTGNIGAGGNPFGLEALPVAGSKTSLTFNTNNLVSIASTSDVIIQKSNSGQGVISIATTKSLTVAGTLTSAGSNVFLSADNGITLAANVSAGGAGGVNLTVTGTSSILEKGISLNTAVINATIDKGGFGSVKNPFKTNATTISVTGVTTDPVSTGAVIVDSATAPTSVTAMGNAGSLFQLTSAASTLHVTGGKYVFVTISDTNKTGSIDITGDTGSNGPTSISTVGGNVNVSSGIIGANDLTLKSTGGGFGTSAALPISAITLAVTAGKNSSGTILNSNAAGLAVLALNVGDLLLQSPNIGLIAPIKGGDLQFQVNGAASVLFQSPGAPITAQQVTFLDSTGNIISKGAIKAADVTITAGTGNITFSSAIGNGTGTVTLTAGGVVSGGTPVAVASGKAVTITAAAIGGVSGPVNLVTPQLTLTTVNSANVSVKGDTTLQTSTIGSGGGSLTLAATGIITESAGQNLTVDKNALITAKAFIQGAGDTFKTNIGSIKINTSGSGNAIDIAGTINGKTEVDLTTAAKSAVVIESTGTTTTPSLLIQTGKLTNSGNVTIPNAAPSFLTITNPTADLSIANSGTIQSPLDFALSSGGNLTVTNSGTFSPFQAGSTTEQLILAAKGILNIPTNTLTVVPLASKTGGTILISASTLVHPAGTLALNADAKTGTSGDGGTLLLTLTGKQNIVVDTTANSFTFSAKAGTTGGGGGSVTVGTGGNLFVHEITGAIDIQPTVNNNNGGNQTLSAVGTLQIEGDINTSGLGTGTAGAVLLTTSAKIPFLIDQGSALTPTSNAIHGQITGGNITITGSGGIDVAAGSAVTSTAGNTQLSAPEVTNKGSIVGALNTTVSNAKGDLKLSGNGTWSTILAANISSGGNLDLGTLFSPTQLLPAVSVTIAAKNTLTLGTADITVTPFFGAGGAISLTATKLAYSIATPAPLTLHAQGPNAGGQISVAITGKTPLTISSTGAGNILVDNSTTNAAPTGTGTVSISNGGDLTVNLSGLITNPSSVAANNTNVSLKAGGALLVNGPWNDFITGAGGNLTASSNSSKAFIVGTPTLNGINTAAAIKSDNISIINSGGDVFLGGTDFLTGGTSVTVTALKNITSTPSETITSKTVTLTSTGGTGTVGIGSKGLSSTPMFISTDNLAVNTGKGSAYIVSTKNASLTLNASSAKIFTMISSQDTIVAGTLSGSQIKLQTDANFNLTVQNTVGDGTGNVTLIAGILGNKGNITQTVGLINAQLLTVDGTSANNLQTNVTQLATNTDGSTSINNVNSKPLTINSVIADTATITTAGALVFKGQATATSNLTFNAGGAVTINNSLFVQNTLAINASKGGAVTVAKGGSLFATNLTLSSDSGDINTQKGSANAHNVVIGTAGNVLLTDVVPNGDITLASIGPVKSFNFTGGTNAAGNLFLNNIATTNGSISVVYSGDMVKTAAGSQLLTNSGSITLQDLHTNGQVFLDTGTNIHASATAANLGQVNIVVGPTPKNPTSQITTPAHIDENFTGKGMIFYNLPATAIFTTTPNNTLNAFGRNIVLSAPGPAPGISLNGSVIITADPPEPAAGAAAALVKLPAALPPIAPGINGGINGGISAAAPSPASSSMPWLASTALSTLPAGSNPYGISTYMTPAIQTSPTAVGQTAALSNATVNTLGASTSERTLQGEANYRQVSQINQSKTICDEAVLIAPEQSTSFASKFGTVELKSNCMALLVASKKGLSIFNLDDTQKGSVVAKIAGKTIYIEPGRHLTISDTVVADFAKVNAVQFLAHRKMVIENIAEFKTFKSEFSVLSALSGLKQLRDFMQSSDPAKQKAVKHLLKTTAILSSLTQDGSVPFELYSDNLVTAMNR